MDYSELELRSILDNYTVLKKESDDRYGDKYYRDRHGSDFCSVYFLPNDPSKAGQFGPKRECFDGEHVVIGSYYDGITLKISECIESLKKHLRGHFYYGEYYLKHEFNNWFSEDFVFVDRPTIHSKIEGQSWEKIHIKDFEYEGNLYKDGFVLYANLVGSLKCKVWNDKFYCGVKNVDFPYDLIEKNYKKREIVNSKPKEKNSCYGGENNRWLFKDTDSYIRYLASDETSFI